MANSIVFRKGTVADISQFLAFFKTSIPTLFPHYSPNSVGYTTDVDYNPQFLSEKLTKGGKRVYLALKEGGIVGYLLVEKSIAGVAFADWLGVEKQSQKQGIASQLLSLWEKDALGEGAHVLHLWTLGDNVEFYKKRDFSCGGFFPKAWHGESCYLIYKALREPDEKNFLKSYLRQIKKG